MEEIHMTRSMTKYQLEHFKSKVRRQFEPLIEDQELLVKQFKAKATDVAVAKLSKKIGADKIIKEFAEAERKLEEARATAITFFEKKKPQDAELDYSFRRKKDSYSDSKLSLSDCEDQLRTWASNQAEKELERRPEGAKLRQLTPDSLAIALNEVSKKIGLSWNQDLTALPNIKNEN
jgi:predicted metal-dependent hydrolase